MSGQSVDRQPGARRVGNPPPSCASRVVPGRKPCEGRKSHGRGERGGRMRRDRIAGAPISWGVCEVPGWGHQLTPERVLDELTGLGLTASEFGPDGFLPGPLLAARGVTAVGG